MIMRRFDRIRKRFPGKKFQKSENFLIIIDGSVYATSCNAEDVLKVFFPFAQSGRLQIKEISGYSIK